ncbi:hypothetical protein OG453_07460 [Streptomyces sp. NBC_01381]|uniref:hypothetical protein n=1 Tax=Streptomyces sp. NBC_01381 TaxID=2903845 RepID=UPI00224F3F2B|nr:hypothetical protein [Streptomyces sp. NBC_01381]MCX4666506.1 hypothetical protein [Streptomyces sp. NBC_01381]
MRTRSLPAPSTVLGYRRDGRPIYPMLGASADDSSNDETSVSLSQKHLSTLMAREKDQGGRAAVRTLVDKLGFASASALEEFVTGARQTEQERLTEAQRREQALAEREEAAAAREATALAREREASRRAVLAGAGVGGHDLDDAVALLRVAEDADEAVVSDAVQELKDRRPELFARPAPHTRAAAAAPGGAPASVPPRRPGTVERKAGAAGLEMARRRGLLPAPE